MLKLLENDMGFTSFTKLVETKSGLQTEKSEKHNTKQVIV